MATLPAFLRRTEAPAAPEAPAVRLDAPPAERDYRLRPLPLDDLMIYCKKIDNSRLVREADPSAGGACWSVIGAACIMLAFLTGVLAPNVANTVAGYKLEALRVEAQTLAGERRTLELQEAQLLSPERLDRLAQGRNLVTPSASQVVHLENKADSKVAMVNR
jgi:hypothetical protein